MGLRDKLRNILSIKDSPRRLAVAFAMGVFVGMSPFIGLHTILGLLFAWLFKLNKVVTITGVFITNPWTIVPIYTFSTWVGAKCLGINQIMPDVDWSHMTLTSIFRDLKPLLMPFALGTLIVGVISALIGYFVVYHSIIKARRNVS